jgi:hypothetical protein
MKDKWQHPDIKYLAVPFTMLVFGMVIGFGLSNSKKKPIKHYPIEVKCYWETSQASSYPTMEADSVKGNTIYKDGLGIVSNNILNIKFK